MSAPSVSVVLPVFNCAEHVDEAVQSILDQDYRDFEFIIVNDGSTDGSGQILETYARKDARIKLVHQKNEGLVAALNKGIGIAKAPFIARMDADDISLASRLGHQVNHLRNHPDCLAVGSDIAIIDDNGKSVGTAVYPRSSAAVQLVLKESCALAHPTVMMRRSALLQMGGYRAAFQNAEDYDLWLRLSELGNLENIPLQLLKYRRHSGQVSTKHAVNQAVAAAMAREFSSLRRAGRQEPDWSFGEPISLNNMDLVKLESASKLNVYHAALVAALRDNGDQFLVAALWQKIEELQPHIGRVSDHLRTIIIRTAWASARSAHIGYAKRLLSVAIDGRPTSFLFALSRQSAKSLLWRLKSPS